ncbi:MAG: hypothetical protein KZQ89_04745 [Candidatus Thiodiazotropha sp. (ex Lucinoma kastoroae)]|nr:hypothetical protein [Candidatus Thiodiazotropha sp. (ex Lucinoma kastoroae)]
MLACLAYLLCVGAIQTMLAYYTFEGSIDRIGDDAGAIAIAGLSVNDPICYVFLIDRERPGTRIIKDGSIFTYNDDVNRAYFFTDLISGSMIHEVNGGSFKGPTSIVRFNRGFESNSRFDLLTGSSDHFINVWGASMSEWGIGTPLKAIEGAYDKHKNSSIYLSHLSLTSISDINLVPIQRSSHHGGLDSAYLDDHPQRRYR